MPRALTKDSILMFVLLCGLLVAVGLWAFASIKPAPAPTIAPKYALLLVAIGSMYEGGKGYHTSIIEIDGKIHTSSREDRSGGILSYAFVKHDVGAKKMTQYDVDVPKEDHRIAIGTFPVAALKNMTVSTNPTSPDRFTYTSCKIPGDEGWEAPCLVKDNKQLFLEDHPSLNTRFIGWIIEERKPA